jgi:hypothetical protein
MSVSRIWNVTPSQTSEESRFSGKLRGAGLAALAALTIAGTSMMAAAPAQARDWHRHHHDRGGAVAAGVIGGLALGAIAGSALAQPAPRVIYEDDYPVEYRRVYRPRRDLPSCSNFRRVDWDARVWIDDYGRAHPCY